MSEEEIQLIYEIEDLKRKIIELQSKRTNLMNIFSKLKGETK